MAETKYQFEVDIQNSESSSSVPDVAFHPGKPMFVVSFRDNNQIRVYDSTTHTLLRTYRNPEAQLDWPHGVIVSERHIIVGNKHDFTRKPAKPSVLNVYRIDDSSGAPVAMFETPFEHLREAHSLALHGDKLLVTYCGKNIGAIVSYHFDDETGVISGPVDIQESWFSGHGEPKGVSFAEQGTRAIITFVTEKEYGFADKLRRARKILGKEQGAQLLMRAVLSKFGKTPTSQKKKTNKTVEVTNGIAIYAVDESGMLSKEPVQSLLKTEFCRLENVHVVDGLCVVSDPINDTVNLYDNDGGNFSDNPVQAIQEHLSFPHGVRLSPDKKMLAITNNGLLVINEKPQWGNYIQPRADKITIYKLQK